MLFARVVCTVYMPALHLSFCLIWFYASGDTLLTHPRLLSQAASRQAALFLAGCSSTATGRGRKSDEDDLK
jgi:hypothetical protein